MKARGVCAAVLVAGACGYHDTPVATYRAPLPDTSSGGVPTAEAGAPNAGAQEPGDVEAGAPTAGAPIGGAAPAPACSETYAVVVPGLTSRYRQAMTGQHWIAAELDCESDGGHLVVIDSEAENDWVKSLAEAAVSDNASTNQLVWLGLGDFATEGTYLWVTGSGLTSATFSAGEPNNLNHGEDCVEMRPSGTWNDDRCNAELTYVCECDGLASAGNWCDTQSVFTCGDCRTACTADQKCTNQECKVPSP